MTLTTDDLDLARAEPAQMLRISVGYTISGNSPGTLWFIPTTTDLTITLGSTQIGAQVTIHNRGVYDLSLAAGVGQVAAETLPTLYAGGTLVCTLTVDGWRTSGGSPVPSDEVGSTGLYAPGSYTLPTGRYQILADNLTIGSGETVTIGATATLVIL
jgi:hypothetical protein